MLHQEDSYFEPIDLLQTEEKYEKESLYDTVRIADRNAQHVNRLCWRAKTVWLF